MTAPRREEVAHVAQVLVDVAARLTPVPMPCGAYVDDYSRPCKLMATVVTDGYEGEHDFRCTRHAQVGSRPILSPEDEALLKRIRAGVRVVDRLVP